jgi:recombination protein RecT
LSAQTVKQATETVSKDLQLINWLRQQQDDLAMAAASHLKPSTIVRVAQGALRKDEKLMRAAIANPQSLIHCLLDAARLGHEAGTDQYWLIPFGNEVTGIEGYKGVIERMYRAGGVSTVHAEVVRQRDAYRSMGSRTPPVHEYDDFADDDERGPLRGVYAYAVMADGSCSQVIRMGKAEVMKHKAMSKGSDRSDSPWQKWEPAMWKKGPLSGLEPYVPTSSEWLMTRAQASAAAQGRAVIAPGWAPPVPAAPAPLQLVSGTVEPERQAPRNVPPAGEQPTTPVPAASSEPPGESAGGTPDAPGGEAHRALVAQAQQHFKRLGYADADREARLADASRLILGDGYTVSSLNDLTPDELGAVVAELGKHKDRASLRKMLDDGTVPGGE